MISVLDIKVSRLHKFDGDKPLKAFADITINDVILIKGIKVIDGKKGFFVSMPQEQGKNSRWYENVRCLSEDVRELIRERVLDAYNN